MLYWLVPFASIFESQEELKAFAGGSVADRLLLTKESQLFRVFIVQNVLDVKLFHGI